MHVCIVVVCARNVSVVCRYVDEREAKRERNRERDGERARG